MSDKRKSERLEQIEGWLKQPTPPSLEVLIRTIREYGYRLNNLFHRADGQFQCNLRTKDQTTYTEFAYAPSAPDAVLMALQKGELHLYAGKPAVGHDDLDPTVIGATDLDVHEVQQPDSSTVEDDDLIG